MRWTRRTFATKEILHSPGASLPTRSEAGNGVPPMSRSVKAGRNKTAALPNRPHRAVESSLRLLEASSVPVSSRSPYHRARHINAFAYRVGMLVHQRRHPCAFTIFDRVNDRMMLPIGIAQ